MRQQVLLNGRRVGDFDRDGFQTLNLPPGSPASSSAPLFAGTMPSPAPMAVLDILVSAVGRQNSRTTYDTKGLSSPDVLLNGARSLTPNCCPVSRTAGCTISRQSGVH